MSDIFVDVIEEPDIVIDVVAEIGLPGPIGPAGPAGPAGGTGAQGDPGPTGPQGPQGLQGPTGLTGATGAQGPQGPQGQEGVGIRILGEVPTVGDLPTINNPGDAWIVTADGDLYVWTIQTDPDSWIDAGQVVGPQGPMGPQGIQGPTGLQGPQGIPGSTGAAGPTGPPGGTGPAGADGAAGATGPAGANGAPGDWSTAQTINIQSGTSYTLVLTDAGKMLDMFNAAGITLTVPPNSSVAFPVGIRIDIAQYGPGQITVAEGSGVTVRATPGKKLRAQYSGATLFKRGTDEWFLWGDLSA